MANGFTLFGEIRVDGGNTVRTLKDIDKELERSKRLVEGTEKSYDSYGKKTATVSRQLEKFSDKNKEISKNLEEVKRKFDKGEITAKQYESALTSAARQTNSLSSQTKNAAARVSDLGVRMKAAAASSLSLGKIGDSLSKVGGSFTSIGVAMLPVTLAFAAASKSILTAGLDYEKSLNTFQAVTKATSVEMSNAAKIAKELGADVTLPATSAKDAAAAMTELAKAGLNVQQSMQAAKGVLQLAAAGQINESQAAEIAANALNAFNLKASDTVRVANLLAAASNASSSEVSDIAQSMQQASAIFATAKVPIEDLTSAISLMSNAGVKGSDAGTSLKTFLQRLQSPTTKAAEAMDALGVKVFDSAGNMKAFPAIIGDFEKALSGLTDEQRVQAINEIFGADAARAASILFKEGQAGFEQMKKAVTVAGAAADLAAAKTKGLGGAWESLKSQLETIGITIFDAVKQPLANMMTQIAQVVGNIGDSFAGLSPKMQGVIVAVGAIVASIAPLAIGLGVVISAIGSFATAVSALGGMSVLGTIIAGVAASLAAMVIPISLAAAEIYVLYKAWETNFAGIQDVTKSVADSVSKGWGTAVKEIQSLTESVMTEVSAFWKENGEDIKKAASTTYKAIEQVVRNFITGAKVLWSQYGEDIKSIISSAWNAVKTVVIAGVRAVLNTIKLISAVINGDWSSAWSAAKAIVSSAFSAIGAIVTAQIRVVGSLLKAIVTTVIDIGSQLYKAAENAGRNLGQGFVDGIKNKINDVRSAASTLATIAMAASTTVLGIRSPSREFIKIGEFVGAGFVIGMENSRPAITATVETLFGQPLKTVATYARSAFDTLTGSIDKLNNVKPPKISESLAEMRDILTDLEIIKPPNVLDRIEALFANNALAGYIKNTADSLKLTVDQFKNLVKESTEVMKNMRFLEQMPAALTGGVDISGGGIGIGGDLGEGWRQPEQEAFVERTIPPPPPLVVNKWTEFLGIIQSRVGEIRGSFGSLNQELSHFASDALLGIADVFANAISKWDGTLKGFFTSVAQGFAQMAKDIIAQLVKIMIYKALLQLFGSVAGGIGGGGSVAGNATSGAGMPAIGTPGFATGGFTANVPTSQVAGLVHGREFVINAKAVKSLVSQYGTGFLESLNNAKGFMQGGFTSPVPAMAGASSVSNSSSVFAPVINMQASGNAEQDKRTRSMIIRELTTLIHKQQRVNR